MRIIFFILTIPFIIGCSSALSGSGVTTDNTDSIPQRGTFNNHWLWGQYNFHINAAHTQVDITPLRQAQHHYNVKTLLENGPCHNCVWITYLKKNPDNTVNLGVALKHPYPGNDYFTGFDVRGIVHFPAHEYLWSSQSSPPSIPIREAGNPELLNKDGYCDSYAVYPEEYAYYDPLLKRYQPGGVLGGGITWGYYNDDYGGVLNPFKCYHSSENRRYFSSSAVVIRDYHIYIPPGEWDFGYSIDACWAPPSKDPVTKVPDDFPLTANCMVNYKLEAEVVGEINGAEPALLVVDAWNHLGNDIPESVKAPSPDINSKCFYWGIEPIDMGDHVRWILPIYNTKGAPPGWYWIMVRSLVDIGKIQSFFGFIEGYEMHANVMQCVRIHVAS